MGGIKTAARAASSWSPQRTADPARWDDPTYSLTRAQQTTDPVDDGPPNARKRRHRIATSRAGGYLTPAPEKFFCKNAFRRKATPFLGQKPFLDRFMGEGAWLNSQNKKSPLPGGQTRLSNLLVSWGPLVVATPLVGSCSLFCDALDRTGPDAERLGHLQDTHALRKLFSNLPFGRTVCLRPRRWPLPEGHTQRF